MAERERKKIGKPLSDAAFNLNWRGGHGGALPLPNRLRYFSSPRARREERIFAHFGRRLESLMGLALEAGSGGTQDFKAGLEKPKKPWFAGKPKMSARRRLI